MPRSDCLGLAVLTGLDVLDSTLIESDFLSFEDLLLLEAGDLVASFFGLEVLEVFFAGLSFELLMALDGCLTGDGLVAVVFFDFGFFVEDDLIKNM